MGAGRTNDGEHYREPNNDDNIYGFIYRGRLHQYSGFDGNGNAASNNYSELTDDLCRADRDHDGIRRDKLQLEHGRDGQHDHGNAGINDKLYRNGNNGRLLFHGSFHGNGEPCANGNSDFCKHLPGRYSEPDGIRCHFLHLERWRYFNGNEYGRCITSHNHQLYRDRNGERLLYDGSFNGNGINAANGNGEFTNDLRGANG